MGFNKKERREAKAQQEEALRLQRQQYLDQQKFLNQILANRDKQNEGVIALHNRAKNWLNRYEKGEDVMSLNPAFAKYSQETADAVQKSNMVANKLGDRMGGSGDYRAKLSSVSSRDIAKSLARLNEEGLIRELDNQRNILMDTSAYLGNDDYTKFSMFSDLGSIANSIFQNATTKRQMAIQVGQQAMGNMLGLINGIVGGATAAFGTGFASSLLNKPAIGSAPNSFLSNANFLSQSPFSNLSFINPRR